VKSNDFIVWYEEDKAAAEFLIEISELKKFNPSMEKIRAGKSFVENPDAIQRILYLDQPDLLVTNGYPEMPVLGIEFCAEAPTGHDIFQRTARVVAAAEFGTPFAFVFPEKKRIERKNKRTGLLEGKWDTYNPLPLQALIQISRFHKSPVLAFFWSANELTGDPKQGYLICDKKYPNLPSRTDSEIQQMVQFVNLVLTYVEKNKKLEDMVFDPLYMEREAWMWGKYYERARRSESWSPLTSCELVQTPKLPDYVKKKTGISGISLPTHVNAREETIVYTTDSETFRSDPFAGNLAGIDYLKCRTGPTIRHRYRNLAMNFEKVKYKQAAKKFHSYYDNNCPFRKNYGPPDRYLTLHLKDGCRYTKQKELRIFCFLADILIFKDAVLF